MKLFFQMQSDQQHNKSLGVSLSLFVLSTLNMTRVHKLGPQQCMLFEILITKWIDRIQWSFYKITIRFQDFIIISK